MKYRNWSKAGGWREALGLFESCDGRCILRPVGFISSEIREGGVRGGRDHRISKIVEGWRMTGSAGTLWVLRWTLYLDCSLREGVRGRVGLRLLSDTRLTDFYFRSFWSLLLTLVFCLPFWRPWKDLWGQLESIWEPFGEPFGVILVTFSGPRWFLKTLVLLL